MVETRQLVVILALSMSSLSMAGSGLMSGRMVFTLRPNSSSAALLDWPPWLGVWGGPEASEMSVDVHVWVPVLSGACVPHLEVLHEALTGPIGLRPRGPLLRCLACG